MTQEIAEGPLAMQGLRDEGIRGVLRNSKSRDAALFFLGLFLDGPDVESATNCYWLLRSCVSCGGQIPLFCKDMDDEDRLSGLVLVCRECASRTKTSDLIARSKSLRALPYPDYLQTAHWQEVRTACLERDGYACRLCGSGGFLNVHHRTYERLGCENPNDVVTLCQPCHQLFHDHGKLATPVP